MSVAASRARMSGPRTGPAAVPDLAAWYDASRITGLTDGQAVATWPDTSGNGRTATQATSGNRPLYKTAILNGKPVVRFDGTDDWLRCDAGTWGTGLAQPNTVLVVASSDGSGTEVVFDGPGGAGRHLLYNGGGGEVAFFAGAQVNVTQAYPYALMLLYWEVNGASSVMRKNAAAYGSGNVGSSDMGGITIGADQSGNSPVQGDIAEIIVYDRLLSSGERSLVESYIGTKYGLF